eukprot:CAMPEP_0173399712 /NCGR_PEP_ID=MMETSP1356-20130122/45711_1 /TAXON_ID=77927 ORGANISM="Hemiselmis virescens, Strain PCC157" /NCGR_SAMPLE_ID=MMETSP1356 /ASSEMBLY_ACC=CAM_ASM_000847 /LENGTH=264 /DNA_ID=CAMNT_0014359473 /DNA_START=101 /DNA_END=891 /DNA_ORIENTATION=+
MAAAPASLTPASSRAGAGAFFSSPSTGHSLYYETWTPSHCPPRASALFFVGVHESADTEGVMRLAAAFRDAGITFMCFEHHGHGRSDGKIRGMVNSWETLCTHAEEFFEHCAAQQSQGKVFVLGHSMGGGICAWIGERLSKQHPTRFGGSVMLAPALSTHPVPWITEKALTAVSCICPWAPLGPADNPEQGMPPQEAKQYRDSPHNYLGGMRLQTGRMFLDFFRLVDAELSAGRFTMNFPFLILHGDKDGAVALSGSERLIACS